MGDPARTGSASLAVSSSRGRDDENGRCWERLGDEDLAMMSCGIPLLDGEDMIVDIQALFSLELVSYRISGLIQTKSVVLCVEKRRRTKRMRTARGRLGDKPKHGQINDKAPAASKVEARGMSR